MSSPAAAARAPPSSTQVTLTAVENTFSDGDFAAPVLATETYAIAPAGSGWQFTGMAGVTTNVSGFTNGSAYAPDGDQTAFIKNNGSMSQAVYFDAGTYSISFVATQRIGYQTQNQQIEVLVDGKPQVVLVHARHFHQSTSAPTSAIDYTYTPYQTANFTVAAGTHTDRIPWFDSATADSTAFIDDVAISDGLRISDGSFEATGPGREDLPDRAQRHRLAVRGRRPG